jgi:hypothetical protein
MYYYACIGEYERKRTNSLIRQPLCVQSATKLELSTSMAALMRSHTPPFGFKFKRLFDIFCFNKDPHDFTECMRDYLDEDPEVRANIACFLMDFNCMTEHERDDFFAFLY